MPTKNNVIKYKLFRIVRLFHEILITIVYNCVLTMWEKVKYTPGIFAPRKTKMRVAPVNKVDLSMPDSKSYWYNVVKNLEAQVTKVSHQSLISFPSLSSAPPAKCSASNDHNDDYNLVDSDTQMRNVARELIVRVSPPSPSHNECVRDINPHDLRHVEHINYLKHCDIGNFQLGFSHEENSRDDVEKNSESGEKKVEQIKNSSKIYSTVSDDNLPPLEKMAQLLKISSYVNEFLSSTRPKIGSTIVPKTFISPAQTPDRHLNKHMNHSSLDQTYKSSNNENSSMEIGMLKNMNGFEQQHDNDKENVALLEKHVGFEDIDANSEECLRLRRTRAPSLGVASAVPSFGKILSSLENSDSTESSSVRDNSSDDNKVNTYSQSPKDFLTVPRQKILMVTESNNITQVHNAISQANSSNSRGEKGIVKSIPMSAEYSNVKNMGYKQKSKHWPKQSITNVIRALNRMKRRRKVRTESDCEILIPIRYSSDPYVDYHSDSLGDSCDIEEASTIPTNSSTTSNQSIRADSIKNSFIHKNKINLSAPTRDGINIKANGAPIRTTMDFKDFETVDTLLSTKDNDTATILNAMPQISAMYSRRKNDKCLACLDTSMKINSAGQNKFSIFSRNIASILPSQSQNVTLNGTKKFDEEKFSYEPDNTSAFEFTTNSRYPGFQTQSFNEDRFDEDTGPILEMYSSKDAHEDDTVGKPIIPSFFTDRKLDQSFEKKNIVSSKPFVSTLSLGSERSKHTSDQDDSDQVFDEVGATDEGTVETKSKFLAPCHAPLNLRPSLEPLKALCGKKMRSIQSRVASLEKTTDHSCDEESDDNEIRMTVSTMIDENKNKGPSPKPLDGLSDVPNECTNIFDKFNYKDKFSMWGDVSSNTSYVQLKKASSILNNIHSQLNIDTNVWDYNPSDSFRPMSPIIPLSEIIEISQNSLNTNKNVIETLHILANQYAKRVAERNYMNSKSDVSNILKIMKTTKRLLALLVDSKFYLNPQYTSSHLDFPSKQKYSINSRQLRKVLPVKSYNLIAPILGLSQWHPKHWSAIKDARRLKTSTRTVTTSAKDQKVQGSISRSESMTEFDLIVHPPSQRGSGLSEAPNKVHRMKRLNPYATFLIKPRRKAVIWRELTKRDFEGYDPEATLKNRAARVTDKICSDFCQWLRSLGGFNTTINEDVLKNMFETDFTAEACKTMQVSINEMSMVPTAVAAIRNCSKADEIEIIQRQLRQDLRAEKKATKLTGFGTTLPQHLKFVPPKNNTENNWLRCENVPEDLETMDAVWKDITHLDSVQGFTQWLKCHPNGKPPMALRHVSYSKRV